MLYKRWLSTAALLAHSARCLHLPPEHLQGASLRFSLRCPLQPLCGVAQIEPLYRLVDAAQLLLCSRLPPHGGRLYSGAEALQVELQAAEVEVGAGTVGAGVGTAVVPSSLTSAATGVEPAVELQVDELREAGRAGAALVGFLP